MLTQRQVYEDLLAQFKRDYKDFYSTPDKLNRKANAFAIYYTIGTWKAQYLKT